MTGRDPADQHLRELVLLRRVRDRIDREYARPLDVEALARGVHLSAGHLSRAFRRAFGEPPYSYLMTRRVERAMALLRRGDLSVTEVCFAVGCASLGTFTTRFTELVGMSPGAYRRRAAATSAAPSAVTAADGPGETPGGRAPGSVAAGAAAATSYVPPDAPPVAAPAYPLDAPLDAAAGLPACVAKQVTRPVRRRPGRPAPDGSPGDEPVRNREAAAAPTPLASQP